MDTTPLAVRKQIEDMCCEASLLFSTGHIQDASLKWHGVVRRLLPMVTDGLEGPGGDEDPAPARLKGAFWVHPLAWEHPSSTMITSGDRTFAVYASAIQYCVSSHPSSVSMQDDLVLAATSVFNLGLCHHLQALLHGDQDAPKRYEKALRAYWASQRILEGSGLFCSSCMMCRRPHYEAPEASREQQGLRLLQLALTNNIGHVYDQTHSHDDARRQLEILHSLVEALYRDMTTTTTMTSSTSTRQVIFYHCSN